jgi:hypothetical protein
MEPSGPVKACNGIALSIPLSMFYAICLFYENIATFCTYDIFDVSRVTV